MQALNKVAQCSCDVTVHINAVLRRSTNLQIVRFRKPRFVPKAKSKIFRVREPTPIDPVEARKLLEWNRRYNTDMKSLRSYLYQYTERLNQKHQAEDTTLTWDQRYERMIKLNDRWNEKVEIERLASEKERELVSEVREQKIIERDEKETVEMEEKARQKVMEVKKMSSEFIAEEDLDREIEKLLNSRVSYEFALKSDGSTVRADEDIEEDIENTEELGLTQETIDSEKQRKPPTL